MFSLPPGRAAIRYDLFILTTSTNGHSSLLRCLLAGLHIPGLDACDKGRCLGGWCPFDADRLAGPLGVNLVGDVMMAVAWQGDTGLFEQNRGVVEYGTWNMLQ